MVVEGRLADGSTELLYESSPACRPPAVRAFEDYFDTSLKRVGDYRMARSLPRKSRREDALATLRRSRWLTREGRYFCDSEAVARSSALTDVYLIWQVDMTSYRTGRRRRSADVVHQVDCRRGRRARTAPPEVEVVRGVGPRVVLDG